MIDNGAISHAQGWRCLACLTTVELSIALEARNAEAIARIGAALGRGRIVNTRHAPRRPCPSLVRAGRT